MPWLLSTLPQTSLFPATFLSFWSWEGPVNTYGYPGNWQTPLSRLSACIAPFRDTDSPRARQGSRRSPSLRQLHQTVLCLQALSLVHTDCIGATITTEMQADSEEQMALGCPICIHQRIAYIHRNMPMFRCKTHGHLFIDAGS